MKNKILNIYTITQIGILSGLSLLLTLFSINVPIFPEFLKIDVSDVPAIIAALGINPFVGISVALMKNVLKPLVFQAEALELVN